MAAMPRVKSSTVPLSEISCERAVNRSGERDQQPQGDGGQPGGRRGADECEERALGQELTGEAPAPGAKRGANRQLPFALQQPRQHQIGHARADDEQQEAGGAEQNRERGPEAPRQLVAKREGYRREPGARRIVLRIRPLQIRRDDRQIRVRGRQPGVRGFSRPKAWTIRALRLVRVVSADRNGHAETGM